MRQLLHSGCVCTCTCVCSSRVGGLVAYGTLSAGLIQRPAPSCASNWCVPLVTQNSDPGVLTEVRECNFCAL